MTFPLGERRGVSTPLTQGAAGRFSFPRSAWERTLATLCVAECQVRKPSFSMRDAERPDVRSHAERGNEKELQFYGFSPRTLPT